MKLSLCLLFITFSNTLWASPLEHRLTIKERIRLSLWRDGLKEETRPTIKKYPNHLEEIERSLRKL